MRSTIAPAEAPPPELPKCFEHDWTAWRKVSETEGDGWERKWLNREERECRTCELYQSK